MNWKETAIKYISRILLIGAVAAIISSFLTFDEDVTKAAIGVAVVMLAAYFVIAIIVFMVNHIMKPKDWFHDACLALGALAVVYIIWPGLTDRLGEIISFDEFSTLGWEFAIIFIILFIATTFIWRVGRNYKITPR